MSAALSQHCWFLTGPTAAGKTAVGVELAGRLGAEIVSLDSMTLYRGMDIGTAKPTAAERRGVPHHLIDILEPHQQYSLAQYLAAAGRSIEEIKARQREVLFVGGTPLYLKGLLRGIFEGPPADWPLRRQLQEDAQRYGPDWLHRRLTAVDPAAAAKLHPNDARRLIRAIEVFEKTGRKISELQQQFEIGQPAEACRVFVLAWPQEELYARIERRVDAMFAAGLVNEVRRLLALPSEKKGTGTARLTSASSVESSSPQASPHAVLPPFPHTGSEPVPFFSRPLSRTARQAVGYREVIEHIEGRHGLAETIELVKRRTRQLAKRQGTWFRSLSECRFVPVSGTFDAAEMARVIQQLGEGTI